VALYGAYNEILCAMGLGSRIKARTKADKYPPSIIELPSIGTHMRPNVELVIATKPDLVLQSAGRREAMTPVNQLKSHAIPVAVFNPVTFEDLFNTISRIGDLTGERRAALSLIENMKKRLERAGAMTKSLKVRPKIFFEVRHPNLVAAGKKSIVNDVIKRAGGVNCIQIPKKLARLNLEAVIDCEPHVYIVQKGPMNREPSKPSNRKNFQVIKAVRNNHILFVDEQIFSRPGPRLVDAVEKLSTYLKKISEQGLDDS
jgi:iron complex transport system substrate-binding protein